MYLLDTSVLIDLLRKREPAVAWFKTVAVDPRVSVISLTELWVGIRRQKEEADILQLESALRALPIDREIALRAGVLLRHYAASHSLEVPDAIIAATAEHHGLRLATLNTKHFPMFPKLKPAY